MKVGMVKSQSCQVAKYSSTEMIIAFDTGFGFLRFLRLFLLDKVSGLAYI